MKLSKYNIISKVHNSNEHFIVNALSGSADILDETSYQQLLNPSGDLAELLEKGYLVDAEEEKKVFREKYLKFLDDREKDEVQIFFVTNYSCNFNCSYCYQAGYEEHPQKLNKEIVDSFFTYIQNKFAGRRKYITIFGGEPFLNAPSHKELIEYIIQQAKQLNIEIAAVTNAYHLVDYIEILKEGKIREIQVTLDGIGDVHNNRRPLKGGGKTFDRIVEGVDLLLANHIAINLRMVVDKENIGNLPELAQFAIDKGWTSNPLFKTQLGRNYELHECQANQNRLYSRLDLYKDLYELLQKHPHIQEFHRPSFSISKFLFENGEMPEPLFDACTGTKTEWAFDFTGKIYACTATVGKDSESLGTFYPETKLFNEAIEEWQERDILSIPKCRECNLALICGGGCASMAKNYNGELNSHDCRPVTELLELGIGQYLND
ncbi:MAG: radical SAM protein [Prolixibacteraceae bacterium]